MLPARVLRRAGALAALALLTMLVAACGGGGNASGGTAKATDCPATAPEKAVSMDVLAFSAPSIDPFTNAMATSCSKVENLTVKHTPVDFGAQLQKANLALSSGGESPYDIVEVYNATLIEYASKGWLEPLDAYIEKYRDKYKFDDIPQELWDAFSYEGKIYGIPNQQNVQILMYRKDIFDKLGLEPPATYAELEQTARKLEDAKDVRYPLAMAWGADDGISTGFANALAGYGGALFDDAGETTFNGPEGVEAVEAMKRQLPYQPKDALTFANGDVMNLIQQGQAAMTVLWAGRAGPIEDPDQSKVVGKMGYAPAPTGEPGSPPATEWSQDGFSMAKTTGAPKDLAFEVMAASATAKVMREAAPVALVSRNSVINDKAVASKQPQWAPALKSIADGAKTLPRDPRVDSTRKALNPLLARAIGGKLSPKEALDKAAKDVKPAAAG